MERTAELVCGQHTFSISLEALVKTCDLYDQNPSLSTSPYLVTSPVSPEIFQEFLSAIQSQPIFPTTDTLKDLEFLCEEFGFHRLQTQLSKFRHSIESGSYVDSEARNSIARLEKLIQQQTLQLAFAQREISLSQQRITTLEKQLLDFQRQMTVTERNQTEQLQREVAIIQLGLKLESRIPNFRTIPRIFTEFLGHRWTLLYRGSQDGFTAKDFHRKCDNFLGTLTVIQTTEKHVFGGFTPLMWSSPPNGLTVYDKSLKSFVFTLENPLETKPMIFKLRADRRKLAIVCCASWGPTFGMKDIRVETVCNKKVNGVSPNLCGDFGDAYAVGTGYEGVKLLTGEDRFLVKEIEVFQVIPET
jgi:hypothetical protein